MFRFMIIMLITINISACSTSTSVPAATTLPTLTLTSEPTLTATATQTQQPIDTPEPTPTEVVNLTFEDWKALISGSYVGMVDGKTYPDRWIFFTTEHTNGISEFYIDPVVIENLPVGTPLLVMKPSGELLVWATPSEAAELAKDGATVMVTKSISPIGQVWAIINAANKHYLAGDARLWVTFDENNAITHNKVAYNIERDLVGPKDESGKFTNPAIPVPPPHFRAAYYDANGNWITEQYGEFKDPEHWLQELLDAGYTGIEFVPN